MEIGIIGLSTVGKSTLFNIVTKNFVDTGFAAANTGPNIGVAKVPDVRLDWLRDKFNPKKTTYATINFVDVAGITEGEGKNESFSGQTLSALKAVDALIHVVRIFDDPTVPYSKDTIDPLRDISLVESELLLSDMAVAENRISRLEQDIARNRNKKEAEFELPVIKKIYEHLSEMLPVRTLKLTNEELKMVKGYTLLTLKPMIYAFNMGESDEFTTDMVVTADVREEDGLIFVNDTPTIIFKGKVEEEIARLSDEEVGEFLDAMGISESAASRLIRTAYHALDLISFFTVGEDECRAWTTTKGDTAPMAAGRIHSDLERGFIRAECFTYDDLYRLGGVNAIKDAGLFRLEGKTHIVEDGEIMNIRFNV